MALKLTISSTDYDKLSDDLKAEYSKDGDGYKLDVSGIEDTGALKRAKDRAAQERDDARQKLKEAEDKLADIEGDDARKTKDVDKLTKQHDKKLADQKTDYEGKLSVKDVVIEKLLKTDVANKLAAEISTAPDLILPHIISRLTVDNTGDEPVTQVLGSDGKASALKIEDLRKELIADKRFATVIKASAATGSGAQGGGGGQGGGSGAPGGKKLSEMTGQEKIELYRSNPEQFNRMKEAEGLGFVRKL